jgi:hypothetical protein
MRALNNSKPSCIISNALDATISAVTTNYVKRSFSLQSNTRRTDLSDLLHKENPRMMPTKVAIIRRSPDTSPALNTRVPDTMASVATVLSGGIAKTIALVNLQTRKQQHTEPKGNTRQTRAPIEEPKRPSAGKPGRQRRKPKPRSTKRMRSTSQATNPSIRNEQQRNAGRKPEYLT